MKSNKKVYFNDDGEEVEAQESEIPEKQNKKIVFDENGEKNASSFQKNKNFKKSLSSINLDKKWYELVSSPSDNSSIFPDIWILILVRRIQCQTGRHEGTERYRSNNVNKSLQIFI